MATSLTTVDTLFFIADISFARLLLNKVVSFIAEARHPESQCGFRDNLSKTDMVFALREIQEKSRTHLSIWHKCLTQKEIIFEQERSLENPGKARLPIPVIEHDLSG